MFKRHPIAPRNLRQRHRLELVKREAAICQVSSQAGDSNRSLLRRLRLATAASFRIGTITGSMRFGQAVPPPKALRDLGDEVACQ